MEPTSFDEANKVLAAPPGLEAQVEPLSVHVSDSQPPMVVSCFKVTAEELEQINLTGRVWLIVMGQTMPPVILMGTTPFPKE